MAMREIGRFWDGTVDDFTSSATPKYDLGSRRYVDGVEYVYIYNPTTSDIPVSYAVEMSGVANYVKTAASSGSPVAGISTQVVSGTTYGFIAVRGAVDASGDTSNTAVIGSPVCNAGNGTITVGIPGTDTVVGTALEANTTAAKYKIQLAGIL